MSNSDPAVRAAVEAFVEQLTGLIRQSALESVQNALAGGGSSSRRSSKGTGSSALAPSVKRRAKGAKRTPEELEALTKQLRAFIAKNPGQRIEPIGTALGVATKELALPVKKLLGEKAISTKGQKRATTYFAK